METEMIFNTLSQYGYLALFLTVFVGIFATPVPDEMVVMSAGLASSMGELEILPAFLVTYSSFIIALSLVYLLGRYMSYPLIRYIHRKGSSMKKAQSLINTYGPLGLSFSYFVPLARHIVPYIVGLSGMPLRQYVRYGYTAGLLWAICYFLVGSLCGEYIEPIGKMLNENTWFIILAAIVVGLGLIYLKNVLYRKNAYAGRESH